MATDHGVLEDVQLLEGTGRLEDRGETRFGAPMSCPTRDVSTLDADASGVDPQESGDAPEQGRLAGAVRADQTRQRATVDADVDIVDGRNAAE
jgi:hypothetical protein